jgi:hypothetical protein
MRNFVPRQVQNLFGRRRLQNMATRQVYQTKYDKFNTDPTRERTYTIRS